MTPKIMIRVTIPDDYHLLKYKHLFNISTGPDICRLPKDTGSCDDAFDRYFYDFHTNDCKPLNYTGCDGNLNNFMTLEACEFECLGRLKCEDES